MSATKTASAAVKAAVPEIVMLALDQIEVVFNPRKNYGDLASLAGSIQENGIKIPIRVKATGKKKGEKDVYELKAGHRRIKAIQTLGVKFAKTLVPAMIQPEGYDEKQEIYDHLATNDGLDMSILEQAVIFDMARKTGDTDAQIARRAGKSQTHIVDALLLFDNASAAMKKQIEDGKTSATSVIQLLKEKAGDTGATEVVLEKAKEIAGDKKVTKKHIDEAQGKKEAEKINNTSSRPTRVVHEPDPNEAAQQPASTAPSVDAYGKLVRLQETLLSQTGETGRITPAFALLGDLIAFVKGDMKATALVDHFFAPEEEPQVDPSAQNAVAEPTTGGLETSLD